MLHWIDQHILNTPWFLLAISTIIFFTWAIATTLVYIAGRKD
jgi:hypothetical protein